jgi:DNA excision repair protein ERCC-6
MGLGKTIQTISFLASVKYSKMRSYGFDYIGLGPTLIICPTTLISQWVDEFREWWPYFRVKKTIENFFLTFISNCKFSKVAVLHESGTFKETPKHTLINKIFKCNGILITTYSSLLIYEQNLIGYNWHYVILDEVK